MQPKPQQPQHQHQQHPRNATVDPTFNRTASPDSSRDKHSSRMTKLYTFATGVRDKLSSQVTREDHNLRVMVGHANLLDALIAELDLDDDKQQEWFNDTFYGSTVPELVEPVHSKDTVSNGTIAVRDFQVCETASSSLDSDTASNASTCSVSDPDSSDDDEDPEHADRLFYFHNLIPPPADAKSLPSDYDEQHEFANVSTSTPPPMDTVGGEEFGRGLLDRRRNSFVGILPGYELKNGNSHDFDETRSKAHDELARGEAFSFDEHMMERLSVSGA